MYPPPQYSSYRDDRFHADHDPRWNGQLVWRGETHVTLCFAKTKKQADQHIAQVVYKTLFPDNASAVGLSDLDSDESGDENKPTVLAKIVYVDADHIAFVTNEFCRFYSDVQFRFYFNKDATLATAVADAQKLANVEFFEAPQPVKNLADTMLLFDLARQNPHLRAIVVSKDAIFYNATLLLDNVTRVGSETSLRMALLDEQ